MSCVAINYGDLGRHAEALVLREKVLEIRRRVLPEDHPDIGEFVWLCCLTLLDCDAFEIVGRAMYNLAISHVKLERTAEALVLLEKVMEFFRRVLPEDHPDIGEIDGL